MLTANGLVDQRESDSRATSRGTMDAPENEQDIQLQRSSPELLADLQSSLRSFLWKTTKLGKIQIRKRVRVRETDRLVNLVFSSSLTSSEWSLISPPARALPRTSPTSRSPPRQTCTSPSGCSHCLPSINALGTQGSAYTKAHTTALDATLQRNMQTPLHILQDQRG